jgi:hypothetical protein
VSSIEYGASQIRIFEWWHWKQRLLGCCGLLTTNLAEPLLVAVPNNFSCHHRWFKDLLVTEGTASGAPAEVFY